MVGLGAVITDNELDLLLFTVRKGNTARGVDFFEKHFGGILARSTDGGDISGQLEVHSDFDGIGLFGATTRDQCGN